MFHQFSSSYSHVPLTLPSGYTVRPGKILCIGRNYGAHVREMGDVADLPTEPVVFLKPSTALIPSGGTVILPSQSNEVHHELELVVVIGEGGRHIPETEALNHVVAYALGLDLTARDLQAKAKADKGPWSIAKGFDTFAPLGPLTPASEITDPQSLTIELKVNGEVRQHGKTAQMIFPVAGLVSYLSSVFTLEKGDLIYTGTPEGVGPIRDGDMLEAIGVRLKPLRVNVIAESV